MAKKSGPPKSLVSKRDVRAKLNEIKALELRGFGYPYQKIGDKMGLSAMGARGAVIRAIKDLQVQIGEKAHEIREIELTRLDKLLLFAMKAVEKGDLNAIDKVIKIMERRAKLLGLDQPSQIDVMVSTPQQVREENRIKIIDAHPEMTDEEIEVALNTIESMEQ